MSDRQKHPPHIRLTHPEAQPEAQPQDDSAGGLATARRLLDRIGLLARQARDTAEGLAVRLLSKGVAAPEVEPAPAPVDEPAPVLESEPDPAPESGVARDSTADADPDLRPAEEGETRVVLLSRDPEWVFCYWNIAPAARAAARVARSRLTLRLHDVTDLEFDGANGWSQHLYPLTEEARWWHVPVPHRGRHYLAEVGYCTAEGTFRPLGRSEAVAPLDHEQGSTVEVELATVDIDAPLTDQASHPSDSEAEDDAADARVDDRDPPVGSPLHRPAAGPHETPPAPGVGGSAPVPLGPSSALWSRQR